MTENLKIILKEFEKNKGEFVLDFNNVVRLVGVAEDELDYFWVFYDGKKLTFLSCVMGYVPLYKKIDNKHYNGYVQSARINHKDQKQYYLYQDITEENTQKIINKHIKKLRKQLKGCKIHADLFLNLKET